MKKIIFHFNTVQTQCKGTINMLTKYKTIGGSMGQIFGGLAPPIQA